MLSRKRYVPFFILLTPTLLFSGPQLTFIYNQGRAGDVFVDMVKNMYLADKYNLEFCVNNFIPFSYYFTLDKIYSAKSLNKKKRVINHENEIDPTQNITYITHRKTVLNDVKDDLTIFLFKKYIEDAQFRQKVKRQLSLRRTFVTPQIPHDHISVALHLRKGTGIDYPLLSQQYTRSFYADMLFPSKFPPDQYFVDQLKLLQSLLPSRQFYVRIFTDDKTPHEIVKRMQNKLGNTMHVCYIPTSSDIEDMYAMGTFDILIRPSSGFSITAQILGSHKLIIAPIEFQHEWQGNYLQITESMLLLPDRKREQLIVASTKDDLDHIKNLLLASENFS